MKYRFNINLSNLNLQMIKNYFIMIKTTDAIIGRFTLLEPNIKISINIFKTYFEILLLKLKFLKRLFSFNFFNS